MASKVGTVPHENEQIFLSAVVSLVRFEGENSPQSEKASEEEVFESYAAVPLSVSLFCGEESRLKVYFDDESAHSETDMEGLGMFNLFDEVIVELKREENDTNNGTILERVSVPVICLDRSKPSDLTLEEAGVTVTISFTVVCLSEPLKEQDTAISLPIPIAAPEEPLKPILEESFFDETKSVDEDNTDSEQRAVQEISKTKTEFCYHSSNDASPQKNNPKLHRAYSRLPWTIRLSDLYKFLKAVIVAVARSRETMSEMIKLLRRTITYLTDGSKVMLSLCIDLSLDAIRQFDMIFSEALVMLDKGMDSLKDLLLDYLQLIVDKVRLQFPWITSTALGMVTYSASKARPWIKATIRCSRPFIQPMMIIGRPVIDFAWPYLIAPTAQKVDIARQKLEKYSFAIKVIHVSKKVTTVVVKEVYDMYIDDNGNGSSSMERDKKAV